MPRPRSRQVQRVGSVRDPDGEVRPAVRRPLGLEAVDRLAADELAGAQESRPMPRGPRRRRPRRCRPRCPGTAQVRGDRTGSPAGRDTGATAATDRAARSGRTMPAVGCRRTPAAGPRTSSTAPRGPRRPSSWRGLEHLDHGQAVRAAGQRGHPAEHAVGEVLVLDHQRLVHHQVRRHHVAVPVGHRRLGQVLAEPGAPAETPLSWTLIRSSDARSLKITIFWLPTMVTRRTLHGSSQLTCTLAVTSGFL